MGEFVNSAATLVGISVISFLLILLNLAVLGDVIARQPPSLMFPLLAVLVCYMYFLVYLAVGPPAWQLVRRFIKRLVHGPDAELDAD